MVRPPVRAERRGSVVVLVLDRPERRNALSTSVILGLGQSTREALADDSVRAIVVTGAGDKAFCAGADLKERQGMTPEEVRRTLDLYQSELSVLDTSPRPVVAALNGAALGGGLELALLCDLRIASVDAELGFPETSLGIIPGAGGTQRLPHLVGEALAKEMIVLGRRLSAEEALRNGLVSRVVSRELDLLEETLRWIEPLTHRAPVATAAALRAIDASVGRPLEEGLAIERRCYEETLFTEDRVEALNAFAEKRAPVFKGR